MSWLSSVFHQVTGTNLSTVTGPLLAAAGTAVGLPIIGGIAGGIAGGVGGGSGNAPQQPAAATPTATAPAPHNPSAAGATTRGNSGAGGSGRTPAASNNTTLWIVGGALGVVSLIAVIAIFRR